jgi:hypothetical protein
MRSIKFIDRDFCGLVQRKRYLFFVHTYAEKGFSPLSGTLLRMYILIWVVDRRPPHRCNREVHGRSEEEPVNVCFLYCYVLM